MANAKHQVYGSPGAPTTYAPPLLPASANCWKVSRRPDGVEELVATTLVELKGDRDGGGDPAPSSARPM